LTGFFLLCGWLKETQVSAGTTEDTSNRTDCGTGTRKEHTTQGTGDTCPRADSSNVGALWHLSPGGVRHELQVLLQLATEHGVTQFSVFGSSSQIEAGFQFSDVGQFFIMLNIIQNFGENTYRLNNTLSNISASSVMSTN
jgi:hypothetical protein